MTDEGERYGPYHIHECLGAGGMATVHRATIELEDGTFQEVALKRMLPQFADDKRFVDDFVREARLAVHLQHPNIVRILELGRNGRTYFIAMELVRGYPLMSLMRKAHLKKQRAPIGVVLAIMREVCDALEHAHDNVDEHGAPMPIVHRDLTPSNLLVTEDGHIKVIDFGVAKALAGVHQTSSGLAKGKLGYMAMEALGGKQLDTRADLFSAGVVMWELITGKRLFRGANELDVIIQVRDGVVARPSELNPDCPSELDDLVLRALARDREGRWPSATAMRRALDGVRRYYREASNPAAVAKWRRQLRAESSLSLRSESEGEIRLSTDDLEEVLEAVDPPDHVPEGSQRAEPPDLEGMAIAVRAGADHAKPKWKDADTLVSEPTFDRKR